MERREEMRALISEEAAEWLLRLKGEKLNSTERLKYVRWLKQSPSHIAEMLRISEIDGLLALVPLTGVMGEAAPGSNVFGHPALDRQVERMSEFKPESEAEFVVYTSASAWRPAWPRWRFAARFAAATVAIVAGVLVSMFLVNWDINTEIGVWRKVTLNDGSVVSVGPLSHLSFDFTGKQRNVYLTKGEAIFQVAKNAERPFLVNTDLAVVRAVGTEFAVTQRDDGRVTVTVKEGKVQVTQGLTSQGLTSQQPTGHGYRNTNDAKASAPLSLVKDERIAISRKAWPVEVESVDAENELAWAEGHLVLDGTTTIREASEEFNRRNRTQIVIEDPEIAEKKACCVFNIDDPESFAKSVATSSKHAVRLVSDGGSTLRIVPANPTNSERQGS